MASCASLPLPVAVETFCTRVDRFHATEAEAAVLKANSGPLERFIRWAAGINKQWDDMCLKPKEGP